MLMRTMSHQMKLSANLDMLARLESHDCFLRTKVNNDRGEPVPPPHAS
jgi:hypothetical protein